MISLTTLLTNIRTWGGGLHNKWAEKLPGSTHFLITFPISLIFGMVAIKYVSFYYIVREAEWILWKGWPGGLKLFADIFGAVAGLFAGYGLRLLILAIL